MALNVFEGDQKKLISVKCFPCLDVALLGCTQSHHEVGRQTKVIIKVLTAEKVIESLNTSILDILIIIHCQPLPTSTPIIGLVRLR